MIARFVTSNTNVPANIIHSMIDGDTIKRGPTFIPG